MAEDVRTGGRPDSYPVSANDTKTHLLGLGEWRAAAEAEGYDDAKVESKIIPPAIREFERRLMMHILPVRYVPTTMSVTDPLIEDSPYPYYPIPPSNLRLDISDSFMGMYTPAKPILAFHRLRIMINPSSPAFEIPLDWIVFEPNSGYVAIQPATPTSQVVSISFGMVGLGMMSQGRNYIPQATEFVFDAGFPVGWESGWLYADLHRALSMFCAKKVLDDLCEIFDPGRASVSGSAFGSNTVINYERFVRKRQELTNECEAWINEYRQNHVGIEVGML